jgi:hypothetical protein
MVSHIKLNGGKMERFEKITEDLQPDLGYEPSNPEVFGMLMAVYSNSEQDISTSLVR